MEWRQYYIAAFDTVNHRGNRLAACEWNTLRIRGSLKNVLKVCLVSNDNGLRAIPPSAQWLRWVKLRAGSETSKPVGPRTAKVRR